MTEQPAVKMCQLMLRVLDEYLGDVEESQRKLPGGIWELLKILRAIASAGARNEVDWWT